MAAICLQFFLKENRKETQEEPETFWQLQEVGPVELSRHKTWQQFWSGHIWTLWPIPELGIASLSQIKSWSSQNSGFLPLRPNLEFDLAHLHEENTSLWCVVHAQWASEPKRTWAFKWTLPWSVCACVLCDARHCWDYYDLEKRKTLQPGSLSATGKIKAITRSKGTLPVFQLFWGALSLPASHQASRRLIAPWWASRITFHSDVCFIAGVIVCRKCCLYLQVEVHSGHVCAFRMKHTK